MDNLDFSAFLREEMKRRNMTLRRLSDLTGISIEHLENFLKDDPDTLPPAPYLRGYLQHLGKALDFDPELWWDYFRMSAPIRSSGQEDSLPRNRFAPKSISKHYWWLVVVFLILVYVGFRFSAIFGKPVLSVTEPAQELAQHSEQYIVLLGKLEYGDRVFINSESAGLDSGGNWQKELPLQPGVNTFEIRATKFLGRETTVLRQVIYLPPAAPSMSTGSTVPEQAPAERTN